MLESVVERLLSRYLAQYVRGISRDKLSVAVWSGNVELEDLHVKPEVSDLLGIPFRVLWGRIQKIKLTIPWSRLGSSPVCVEVAGLHVLLEPKPIPEHGDEELTRQLREVKRKQVEACEQQMHDARLRLVEQQLQQASTASSNKEGDGGFFFRFVNKILSNLLVDIRDVHIALVDPVRGFKLGVLLSQASIHNTDAGWKRYEQHQQQQSSVFHKACELSGLAVYCALDGPEYRQNSPLRQQQQSNQQHPATLSPPTPPPPSAASPSPSTLYPPGSCLQAAEAAQQEEGEHASSVSGLEPPASLREQNAGAALLDATAFNVASSPLPPGSMAASTNPASSSGEDCRSQSSALLGSSSAREGASAQSRPTAAPTEEPPTAPRYAGDSRDRKKGKGKSEYVLKPLHLRLTLSHATAQQELVARLEVLRESQGIEIGRSQLEALLAISNEAAQRRQRCEQLLLRKAHTVMLGVEGLEGKTQREFIGLYSRQLQAEAGIRGVTPLNEEEQQRLQVLHDVVGVRHLAKWRNICAEATSRVLQQTQFLQQQQQQQQLLLQKQHQLSRQQQQSWWQWVTGRQAADQQQQQNTPGGDATKQDGDADAPLLTTEDIQLIVDAVQSDELMQSVSLPTKYVLTFELEHFSICLKNDNEDNQEDTESETANALRDAKAIKAIGYSPTDISKALPANFPQPPPPPALAAAAAAGDAAAAAVAAAAAFGGGSFVGAGAFGGSTAPQKAFLSVELFNLCAALDLLNKQDAAGRDSSEWSFCISLSNFSVRQQSHLLMHFRRDEDSMAAAPVPLAAASAPGGLSAYRQRLLLLGAAVPGSTAAALISSSGISSNSRLHASSLTAATLELRHHLTATGNILGVYIRLAPLVAAVKPELLRTLCDFFVFEVPPDVKRLEEEAERRSSAAAASAGGYGEPGGVDSSRVATEVDEMRKSEFVEGLKEKGETVYSAAVQHLPDLVQLDLLVAAPILHLDGKAAGSIALHLGTLSLRSDGACPYDALRGVLEFNETRLVCAPTGHQEVSILRPIPIRMHVEVLKMTEINLNILFEEIFLELTPEAIGLLIAVPASMAKSLLQVRPQQVAGPAAPRTLPDSSISVEREEGGEEAATDAGTTPTSISGADILSSLVGASTGAARRRANSQESMGTSLGGEDAETSRAGGEGNSSSSATVTGERDPSKPQLVFASTLRFGRCGFLLRGSSEKEAKKEGEETCPPVLQAELSELLVQLSADFVSGRCGATAELQQVLVSDPSTNSPLFLSVQTPVMPAESGDWTTRSCSSFTRSGSMLIRAVHTPGNGVCEDEEFHDAVEETEKSLRVELQTSLGGKKGSNIGMPCPTATLSVTSLPVELHWRQQSLRQILQTLAVYRRTVHARLQLHIDELSEASAAALGPRGLLSKEAVAAVHDTLQTVQQTLSFVNEADNAEGSEGGRAALRKQRSSSGPSSSSLSGATHFLPASSPARGRDWLQTGLDVDNGLPPLAAHRQNPDNEGYTASPAAVAGAAASGQAGTKQQQQRVSLEMTLTFREVAVAFWEGKDTILARMALKDLTASSCFFANGDTETTFTVGDGGIVFRDRCVLGPRSRRPVPGHQPRISSDPIATAQAAEQYARGGSSGLVYPSTSFSDDVTSQEAASVEAEDRVAALAAPSALFTARIRQYCGTDPELGRPPPYSICVQGQMQQICFVYRQKDVSRTLDYLRDGIFDVFISKSYRAVKEAATGSYCLFALDIHSPLFILAEDKEVIPGYVPPPGYRLPRSRRRTAAPFAPAAGGSIDSLSAPAAAASAVFSQMEVQVDHLGRFIVLDLGSLKVRNAYVQASRRQQQQQQQRQQQHKGSPLLMLLRPPPFGRGTFAGGDDEGNLERVHEEDEMEKRDEALIYSDLRLEMKGMRISASDNGQETAVGGCLLESVDAFLELRSGANSLCIEAETTAWLLHLSRQQLTLIFDCVNENIGGHGYSFPVEVLQNQSAAPAAASSPVDGDRSTAVGMEAFKHELEAPPLAVECRMVIPQLTLKASYGPEAPLALLSVHRITARVAATVSRLFSSYRFVLCGEAFSIDDLRSNAANYYKRVADCTARERFSTFEADAQETDDDAVEGEEKEAEEVTDSPEWASSWSPMSGESSPHERPCADAALESPLSAAATRTRKRRLPGLRFEFASSLRESFMDFQFSGVTVYVLLVAFMDILSYFTSAWAFSSMRSYPKPLPTLVNDRDPEQQRQQERVDTASVNREHVASAQLLPTEEVDTESLSTATISAKGASSSSSNVDPIKGRLSCSSDMGTPLSRGEEVGRICEARHTFQDANSLDPISVFLSGEALRERPFSVSVNIRRGRFLVYSNLQSPSAPVILWTSDFFVRLSLKGDEVLLDKVQVLGSKICRLDTLPSCKSVRRSQTHIGVFRASWAFPSQHSAPLDTKVTDKVPGARATRWKGIKSACSSSSTMVVGQSLGGLKNCQDNEGEAERQQQLENQRRKFISGMLELQRLHQPLMGGKGILLEHLAPHTDPASAVLLCEQFHLEGSGVYRSTVSSTNRYPSVYKQQQQEASCEAGSAAGNVTQQSQGRVPAAVHSMQQALASAAARVPPSLVNQHPPGGRRAPPVPKSSASAAAQQQPHLWSLLQNAPSGLAGSEEAAGSRMHPTSFIDMSFDIPLFFLRVSSRDMALLLAAAQNLHSDEPSVCPQQQPPPIRLPEVCVQQEEQQRQLQKQQTQDETPRSYSIPQQSPPTPVERTAKISLCLEGAQLLLLDDLRSSVLPVLQLRLAAGGLVLDTTPNQLQVALRDFSCGLDYLNAKAGCWEPFIEKLDITAVYRRDYTEERQQLLQRQKAQMGVLEAPAGEDPWGSFRAARTLMLHSQSPFWLNCTPQLCELLAWFLPYLFAHLTDRGVGKTEEHVSEATDAERESSCRSINSRSVEGAVACTARSTSPAPFSPQIKGDTPISDIQEPHEGSGVHTTAGLCLGIRGQLSPSSAPAATDASSAVADEGRIKRDSEAAFRYLNLTGECLYAFTLQRLGTRKKNSSGEQQKRAATSSFSSSLLGEADDRQTVGSLLLLVPGSASPLPLDGLMQNRTAEASRRARRHHRFYLTNCPPVESVVRLSEMFPNVSLPAISRSVLETHDIDATTQILLTREEMRRKIRSRNIAPLVGNTPSVARETSPEASSPASFSSTGGAAALSDLLRQQQQQQQQRATESLAGSQVGPTRPSVGSIDPSPAVIGPFPKGTKAVAVDCMRNCCVALLPPVRQSLSNRLIGNASVAGLRGARGIAATGGAATDKFHGNSRNTASSKSKFAVRQLQRLRSSLTTKDRRHSSLAGGNAVSPASFLSATPATTEAVVPVRAASCEAATPQQQQRQQHAQPKDSSPVHLQAAGKRPVGLHVERATESVESASLSLFEREADGRPQTDASLCLPGSVSGYRDFLESDLHGGTGGVSPLHQEKWREPSVSNSFSAPLPLAHVESHSEAICQVLSPHPSYKLLLVSSTVLLHNKSGLPMEVCFLDADLNPILLPAAHGAYVPICAIGETPNAGKGDRLSAEEPSSLHPDLCTTPQWMLNREQRWKNEQQSETLQQEEQLRLLLEDGSVKPLKRSLPNSLRRATTDVTRLSTYQRAVSKTTLAAAFLQLKEPTQTSLLKPPNQRQMKGSLTYTFLLPNAHVLSVPQRAILGPGWCNVCFRPAAFAEEAGTAGEIVDREDSEAHSDAETNRLPHPPDMSCVAGWCDLIDTRQRMEGLRCRHSAYLPASFRPGLLSTAAYRNAVSAADEGQGVKSVRSLFFLVSIEGHKGALPAEKELKRVMIFPSLTLVNATSTELEVKIAPSSMDMKSNRKQLAATLGSDSSSPAVIAMQELHALQQKPALCATLRRHSTFLVYDVPPNRPLKFSMRFAMLEGAEWSSVIPDFLNNQEEVVSRVLLPSRRHASVELEVLHDTAEVAPFLPFVSPRQLTAVISAPRTFVDRTGLGVRPAQDGRFFPEFDGQTLLGDSATSEVTLVLPRSRGLRQPVECHASVPALGGYSHAALGTKDRYYTLRLKTEKMVPSETAGAICRVVSLVPEFILTNALNIPLFFRQYGTQGPAFEVDPGQSYPVYWASSELPQAIQFRPGTGEGYAWSGAVVASEETAGKSWIALYNGMKDATPGVFCVEVAPDGGIKSICIRGADGNTGGFLVANKCPAVQRVMVHTYHTEMHSQNSAFEGGSSVSSASSSRSRHSIKLPDFDFHFFANEGETVAYGWPFPFTYSSRPCQVLLWLDDKTVAPKSPIVLDLETPQYKRYEVDLGLKEMPQIIVRTEKRGDAMLIEVRLKPGTGPEHPFTNTPSSKSQGIEGETASESPLRSLHVAVNMAQVGVSLIHDAVREELCFAELSQLAIGFQERGERQKLLVRIADIQIDNQMEHGRKPVLLANRGGAGHSSDESFSAHVASKPFLSLFVVRHHTTSSDVILRRVQLEVDNLEVEIDADVLNGLNDFFWACMTSLGLMNAASRRTVSAEELEMWLGSPIHQTYGPPPLPTVLSLESMLIDKFDVYCWCSFVLDKMHMLSDLLKVGLRILMASGRLELMGAKLNFQREEFRNLRGTAKTFVASLQERYTYHLLNSVFSSLGQSSLLNLPRMPYELGKNTIGLAANAVDSVSAGLGSLLSTFTFDSEYINRRQRERGKSTSSMRDGFLSAGKNIGEGVWSLTNIVTKPIEGAQREGVGGFFKGIGKGIVGSLVKPLDKVGQAVSDVTRGIKAEVSKPIGASKCRNERRRRPRMLGELGEIRPYDETEATIRECLGLAVTRRLQKFFTVSKEEALPPRHFVVLFYPKDIFFVDLHGGPRTSRDSQVGDQMEGSREKHVTVLWHISIPLVRDIRASTHGIIIRAGQPSAQKPKDLLAAIGATGDTLGSQRAEEATVGRRAQMGPVRHAAARDERCYQIPCASACLISQLYKELLDAQHGSTSVVQLGTWDAQRYADTDSD